MENDIIKRRALPVPSLIALALWLMLLATPSHAQCLEGDDPTATSPAAWIVPPAGPQRDGGVYYFRRDLQLKSVPTAMRVRVSADAHFILYVNGRRVGEGPAKGLLSAWKMESFDLAPYLQPGSNRIAAVVWSWGVNASASQISSRTAFLLMSCGDAGKDIATDANWEVSQARGHGSFDLNYSKVLNGYFAAPPGEWIDERQLDPQWNEMPTPAYHDKQEWAKALPLGRPSLRGASDAGTIWMLVPDNLPAMEYTDTEVGRIVKTTDAVVRDAAHLSFSIAPHRHASILIDRGSLTTAYPQFTLSGGAAARVRTSYAEALVDEQGLKGNRNETEGRHIVGLYDEFTMDGGGNRRVGPLEWRTWRYLQVDVTTDEEALNIDGISATFTAYPFVEKGAFESNDPALKQIWDVGWRTARLDAHDTYMDTPYWERLQYIGDTRIQALISYSVAGDDRLARQAIDAMDSSRISDGLTQSRAPAYLVQMIPPFSLLWVGMLHDFWMYRPDAAFVQSHLEGERAVLAWFLARRRSDGLLQKLPWWNFGDWSDGFNTGVPPQDADGGSVLLTLQLVEALRNAAQMEDGLGDAHFASAYRAAAEQATRTIVQHCWNEQAGLIADTPSQAHFSEQANALAVWLHAVPRDKERVVVERMRTLSSLNIADRKLPYSTASYYFRFYSARALDEAGMGDQYLDSLQPWKKMLAMGLSTWAEQPEPTRSDSHAWSSHPNYDLLRIVAGITPMRPGFTQLRIQPHPGSLARFKAAYPHPEGPVTVELQRHGSHLSFTISLPHNLKADFLWKGKSYSLHEGLQTVVVE